MSNIFSNNQLKVVLSTAMVMAAVTACSKGGNRPAGWNGDGSSLQKLFCTQPDAFDADKVTAPRLALMKSTSDEYVVKTSVREDAPQPIAGAVLKATSPIAKPVISTKPIKTATEFEASADIPTIAKDCQSGNASYMGPGVDAPVTGRIVKIDLNSITIASEIKDADGAVSAIQIHVTNNMPDMKADRAGYQKYKQELAQGLGKLTITIDISGKDGVRKTVIDQVTLRVVNGQITLSVDEVTDLINQTSPQFDDSVAAAQLTVAIARDQAEVAISLKEYQEMTAMLSASVIDQKVEETLEEASAELTNDDAAADGADTGDDASVDASGDESDGASGDELDGVSADATGDDASDVDAAADAAAGDTASDDNEQPSGDNSSSESAASNDESDAKVDVKLQYAISKRAKLLIAQEKLDYASDKLDKAITLVNETPGFAAKNPAVVKKLEDSKVKYIQTLETFKSEVEKLNQYVAENQLVLPEVVSQEASPAAAATPVDEKLPPFAQLEGVSKVDEAAITVPKPSADITPSLSDLISSVQKIANPENEAAPAASAPQAEQFQTPIKAKP